MTKKTSPVRSRALVHMQRLLATSAAVALANEACQPKAKLSEGDTVPFGPPTPPDAGTTTVVTDPPEAPDANASTVERHPGYMVVDPVPRPAHCPDIAPKIHGKATRAGKNLVVSLSLADGRADFKYVPGQTPTIYGGKLVSSKIDGSGAVVTITPATASAEFLSVSLKGQCNKGFVTISAGLDSDTLAVSISEY